eukprot:scaffold902_cov242-Pinguiococcus_pyrenoidosus.AAC.5
MATCAATPEMLSSNALLEASSASVAALSVPFICATSCANHFAAGPRSMRVPSSATTSPCFATIASAMWAPS